MRTRRKVSKNWAIHLLPLPKDCWLVKLNRVIIAKVGLLGNWRILLRRVLRKKMRIYLVRIRIGPLKMGIAKQKYPSTLISNPWEDSIQVPSQIRKTTTEIFSWTKKTAQLEPWTFTTQTEASHQSKPLTISTPLKAQSKANYPSPKNLSHRTAKSIQ